MVVPQPLEQLLGEGGPGLDLKGVLSRIEPILGKRRPFEVAVFGDDGLMMEQGPQPRHIDPVGGQIIHETQTKLVVVDGGSKVTVENLEAVVRRHVKGVLDVLNGDLTLRHAVDTVP